MKHNYSPEALKRRREYNKRYQSEHRKELAEKRRKKYYLNHEEILAKAVEYRQSHLEQIRRNERENYRRNAPKIREQKRIYFEEHPEIAKEIRDRAYDKNSEKRKAYSRRYSVECPEKRYAHSLIQRLIETGEINRKPCSVCGSENRIEAHHKDYSKPLEIIWLCHKHHMEIHKLIKEA
ncbi:MAG: hypothetical protein LBQ89_07945 [Treponema sp.]|jgi:hypothetical protein|nr:hypothetical protein [Treponema sp.]